MLGHAEDVTTIEETNKRDDQNKEHNQKLPEGAYGSQKIAQNTYKMHVKSKDEEGDDQKEKHNQKRTRIARRNNIMKRSYYTERCWTVMKDDEFARIMKLK